jgi:hypothetical protein
MTTSNVSAPPARREDEEEQHRLSALEGLAALSLDALSSVAYGPEAILIVLVAAGAAGLRYAMPITIAIVVLLAVLVISYRQVIAAFPSGGGAYAVAKRHLGAGASLTAAAWVIVLVIPLLIAWFVTVHRAYVRIGAVLGIGQIPPLPQRENSLVVVPVVGLSRLTQEALSAATSLGDQVTAVYICYEGEEEDEATARFKQQWAQWGTKVPLVTLYSPHRTLGPPIVSYLRQLEGEDTSRRLVVLIAELEPMRAWQWILHNQRGAVLERAVRHDTTNVVVCRIRFQPTTWSAD